VSGEDSYCAAMLKNIQVMVLFWQYHKYKYNSDGTFSDAFVAEICSAPCFAPPPVEEE
jgi:hypothetical protein